MVQKLLELQLKSAPDARVKRALFRELGDVFCDVGEYERAAEATRRHCRTPKESRGDIGERLLDAQVGADEWQERIATLLRDAQCGSLAGRECRDLLARSAHRSSLRAGRIRGNSGAGVHGRSGQCRCGGVVRRAAGRRAAHGGRFSRHSVNRSSESKSPSQGGRGVSLWRTLGAPPSEPGSRQSILGGGPLRLDPSREPAFTFLKDAIGVRGSDWERVIRLADELSDRAGRSAGGELFARNGRADGLA